MEPECERKGVEIECEREEGRVRFVSLCSSSVSQE